MTGFFKQFNFNDYSVFASIPHEPLKYLELQGFITGKKLFSVNLNDHIIKGVLFFK